MIADSLTRQFLISKKSILNISKIEDNLGMPSRSLYKWIIGKRPLSEKWHEPLTNFLFPMLDPQNDKHISNYQFDKVLVLTEEHLKHQFKAYKTDFLRIHHFEHSLINSSDIVYYNFTTKTKLDAYKSLYSKY